MIQWALCTSVRAAWGELAGWGCCRGTLGGGMQVLQQAGMWGALA